MLIIKGLLYQQKEIQKLIQMQIQDISLQLLIQMAIKELQKCGSDQEGILL